MGSNKMTTSKMKNTDLQRLVNVINSGSVCSFLLKNVKVLRAARSLATIGGSTTKVRVFVEVEADGKITRWDAEAQNFQVLDGTMTEI